MTKIRVKRVLTITLVPLTKFIGTVANTRFIRFLDCRCDKKSNRRVDTDRLSLLARIACRHL